MFSLSLRRIFFIVKSFFHDLFSRSITLGYRRLQGMIGGYRGLQEVTGSYKGLQRIKRGYRRLEGVTSGYRGFHKTFFLSRTSPGTFSGSILHKKQS